MRTFADMTPEERAECVGMWGQHRTLGLVIISTTDGIQSRGINVEIVRFLHDGRPIITWEPTNSITPRLDLPRAWTADGTPPAGEWEHAEYLGDYKGMTDVYHFDGEPTHRRWKGEWEEA